MTNKLLITLLAVTSLTPVAALAQTGQPTNSTAAASATAETNLSEIMVTAQRREERLHDVPIAITALSATQLSQSNIHSTSDLSLLTTGLNFYTEGAYTNPVIRGVGTGITGDGAAPNVAVYIDGVYQPSQQSNNFQFNNVANVQVLKGPQGTLFGRNATGGAILVTTAAPSFSPYVDAWYSYGSFNENKASVYATGPLIGDQLAASVAAFYDHDNGYVYNVGTNSWTSSSSAEAIRGKLLWQPNSTSSVTLTANWSNSSDSAPFANANVGGLNQYNYQMHLAGITLPTNPYEVSLIQNPQLYNQSWGAAVDAKTQIFGGTLTDVLSYENVDPFISVDTSNTQLAEGEETIRTPEQTVTEELDFASKQYGPLNFVTGVYLFWDSTDSFLELTSGLAGAPLELHKHEFVATNSEAGFFEVNYNITDKLRLTAGVRYTSEAELAYGGKYNLTTGLFSCSLCNASTRWNSPTPRVVLQYRPDQYNMVYASFSEGFKSGVYNVSTFDATPVSPEHINAYEIGYKYERGPITFSVSPYYYDYSNIQVEFSQFSNGTLVTTYANAAEAVIYGLDSDFTARLNEHFVVTAGFEWTHARYGNFPGDVTYTPIWKTMGSLGGTACAPFSAACYFAGQGETVINGKGLEVERAPEYSGYVTGTYTHPLSVGGLEANVSAGYTGQYFFDAGNQIPNPAHWLVNSKISWVSPNERFTVSVWGTNLTNSLYYIWGQGTSNTNQTAVARPRSIGVMVEAKFP